MSLSTLSQRQMVPSLVQDLLDHIAKLEQLRGIDIEDSPEAKKLFSLAGRLQTAVDAGIKVNQPNSRWTNQALDELEDSLEKAAEQADAEDDIDIPSSALSAIRHFRAQFKACWAWRIALCSLTPGGSEYTTPDACVAFVREARTRDFNRFKDIAFRKKEIEGQLAEALTALAPFAGDAVEYDRPDHEDTEPALGKRTIGDYRRAKAASDRHPLASVKNPSLSEDALRRRSEAALQAIQARSRETLLTEIARRCCNPSSPDLVSEAALHPDDRTRAAAIVDFLLSDVGPIPPDMDRAQLAFVDAGYDRTDDPPAVVQRDQIRAAIFAARVITDLSQALAVGEIKARLQAMEEIIDARQAAERTR